MAIKGRAIPISVDFEADIDGFVYDNPGITRDDIISITADQYVLYIVYDDGT
jgi:hypothetical protein